MGFYMFASMNLICISNSLESISRFPWCGLHCCSKDQHVKHKTMVTQAFCPVAPLRCCGWCVWLRFPRRWRTSCTRYSARAKNWAAWWCSPPACSSSCRPSACRCSALWRSWTDSPRSPGWETSRLRPSLREQSEYFWKAKVKVVHLQRLLRGWANLYTSFFRSHIYISLCFFSQGKLCLNESQLVKKKNPLLRSGKLLLSAMLFSWSVI